MVVIISVVHVLIKWQKLSLKETKGRIFYVTSRITVREYESKKDARFVHALVCSIISCTIKKHSFVLE